MSAHAIEFGDTESFAVRIELLPDPDEGRFSSPEETLSWGRFDLWVQGRNLCAPHGATWYLLPLFEWLVRNWDALFHESKLPVLSDVETSPWAQRDGDARFLPYLSDDEADRRESLWYEWSLRHALRSAAEGGVFPDILLLREGGCARFSWGPPPSTGMPSECVFEHSRGDALLPLNAVCVPLFEALRTISDSMVQWGRASALQELSRLTALQKSVMELRTVAPEERLTWLSGIAHTLEDARRKVAMLQDRLGDSFAAFALDGLSPNELVLEGSSLASMMYGSTAPEIGEKDVLLLARSVMALPPSDVQPPRLPASESSVPFLEGYETAELLHEHLRTNTTSPNAIDIEAILRRLGVYADSILLDDERIMGVAVSRFGCAPSILVNEQHEKNRTSQGRRFTLAHELCHLLLDREHGRPLAVASGPWAPRAVEKRANAFAAMLLMPKPMLDSMAAEYSEDTLADAVAERLKTGKLSTKWHLINLGFLPEDEESA